VLATLAGTRPTIVAGSTWPADEAPLLEGFLAARRRHPELRMVLAPHELIPSHLESLDRWSGRRGLVAARVDSHDAHSADVVLVDRFGLLGDLYALADVAFVGGGFHSAGLHSVLEPAAYGAPVSFGPRYHKSRDASLLLADDAARVVASARDVERLLLAWIDSPDARRAVGARARAVVERGRGAADRSLRLLERLLEA
jgi:3-deoxy-D-manno-octulosonic-acid transferase